MLRKSIFLITALIFSLAFTVGTYAQQIGPEPPVVGESKPKTPSSYGLKNGLGFKVALNNFGFGIGGEYRKVISPMSEATLDLQITALRNVSEQTFQTYFGQIIPNKYNRVLAFPLMVGIKHRIFAKKIQDNFRIYLAGAAGPSLAFIYPYFKDYNHNHIRDELPPPYGYGLNQNVTRYEPINDIFTDWKDGHFKFGGTGKLAVGIDFGSKMKHITSVEFGYYFQYFPQGIQILQPVQYKVDPQGQPVIVNGQNVIVPAAGPQKYFGSPVITLVFGGMW